MTRRHSIRLCSLVAIGATLGIAMGKDDGKIGKMTPTEFEKANVGAGEKLKAIHSDKAKLTQEDQTLLTEIAMGGLMQLLASQFVAGSGNSGEVKALAKAEVIEQTALAEKLKELAEAKGATIPTIIDEDGTKMLDKMKDLKGAELDQLYLKNIAIKGHQSIKATMMKVTNQGKDPMLKAIATAALPLIEIHLTAAMDELDLSK